MSSLLFHGINLVLLLTIIVLVARKKIRESFDRQAEEFQAKVKEAGAQYEQTKAAYETLKSQMNDLETRLSEMRRSSMKEIENESSRIEEEAERQIQMAIKDGELRIKTEGDRLKLALEGELLDGALQMARKTLDRELKAAEPEWIAQMAATESGQSSGKKNYAS